MSWIVQNLWSNRDRIRNKSHPFVNLESNIIDFNTYLNRDLLYTSEESEGSNTVFILEPSYDDPFIESDEFNDLLVIERAINELRELKLLSEDDIEILYTDESSSLILTRNKKYWFDKKRYKLCQRIAYYLGGYFTDEGYIQYLTNKYHITPEQQEIAREYMSSKFKNKILSKGYRIETNDDKFTIVSAEV